MCFLQDWCFGFVSSVGLGEESSNWGFRVSPWRWGTPGWTCCAPRAQVLLSEQPGDFIWVVHHDRPLLCAGGGATHAASSARTWAASEPASSHQPGRPAVWRGESSVTAMAGTQGHVGMICVTIVSKVLSIASLAGMGAVSTRVNASEHGGEV